MIDQLSFSEFINTLDSPSYMAEIELKPLGPIVLNLESKTSQQIINLLTGGDGVIKTEMNNELTSLELPLLNDFIKTSFDSLVKAWSSVININPKLKKYETNPVFLQTVSQYDVVILVEFEIQILDEKRLMKLCIPYISIQDIIDSLLQFYLGKNEDCNIQKDIENTSLYRIYHDFNLGEISIDELLNKNNIEVKLDEDINSTLSYSLFKGNDVLSSEQKLRDTDFDFSEHVITEENIENNNETSNKTINEELIRQVRLPMMIRFAGETVDLETIDNEYKNSNSEKQLSDFIDKNAEIYIGNIKITDSGIKKENDSFIINIDNIPNNLDEFKNAELNLNIIVDYEYFDQDSINQTLKNSPLIKTKVHCEKPMYLSVNGSFIGQAEAFCHGENWAFKVKNLFAKNEIEYHSINKKKNNLPKNNPQLLFEYSIAECKIKLNDLMNINNNSYILFDNSVSNLVDVIINGETKKPGELCILENLFVVRLLKDESTEYKLKRLNKKLKKKFKFKKLFMKRKTKSRLDFLNRIDPKSF